MSVHALATPRELGYDEYTDRTLSVGRSDNEGEDWSPRVQRLRKMKSVTFLTSACVGISLRDCFLRRIPKGHDIVKLRPLLCRSLRRALAG